MNERTRLTSQRKDNTRQWLSVKTPHWSHVSPFCQATSYGRVILRSISESVIFLKSRNKVGGNLTDAAGKGEGVTVTQSSCRWLNTEDFGSHCVSYHQSSQVSMETIFLQQWRCHICSSVHLCPYREEKEIPCPVYACSVFFNVSNRASVFDIHKLKLLSDIFPVLFQRSINLAPDILQKHSRQWVSPCENTSGKSPIDSHGERVGAPTRRHPLSECSGYLPAVANVSDPDCIPRPSSCVNGKFSTIFTSILYFLIYLYSFLAIRIFFTFVSCTYCIFREVCCV